MLFNSYEFIFMLLPVALVGNWVFAEVYAARVIWLLGCSLFFYGWWNPAYLPLFLATIAFNYLVGSRLRVAPNKALLCLGVAANLLLIGYYKYAGFFVENFSSLTGIASDFGTIALPLAISFFTFQQIAYLADCYAGKSGSYNLFEYGLFVSFFPQLIAGPIVHHAQVMPQIRSLAKNSRLDVAVGSTIFAIGLFKKTVLADGIAPYANGLFDNPAVWNSATFLHAWMGVLAYGLQIYFDFSGYSDMAIGAARMFGIQLPLNFSAPYRAETISDFWRRWHMTLSHFLRDYLYIPLGGNRYGRISRYRNLLITMILGGLWHGAGWTFVLWGFLHGMYLVVQHAWSHLTRPIEASKRTIAYRFVACAMTFIAVHFAWAYFRANSLESANQIVRGMLGLNGTSIPSGIAVRLGSWASWLTELGIAGDRSSGADFVSALGWIAALSAIVWFLPTTQEFLRNYAPAWEYTDRKLVATLPERGFGFEVPFRWQPIAAWSLAIGIVTATGILSLPEVSEFLYFQF